MDFAIVTRDSEIMSGALCFSGTRVPVKNLFDYLEGSSSLEEFLENFPSVSRERAVAVLEAAHKSLAAIAEVEAAWDVESADDESELFLNAVAFNALDAPKRTKPSNYPEPFASQMQGREKRPLGDLFRLTNFGVNLTQLAPGAVSSLRHAHTTQDEFIFILEGHPTLHTDEGRTRLSPGMCAGFKAGTGNGHRLVNETSENVMYLEVGDRSPGDEGIYPDDDLKAVLLDSKWVFQHKDGTPYGRSTLAEGTIK